uniref:MIF4G domain-containing protein n=1 Tax=Tetraodon nigroviridis TaxID=99883 RepID=H3CS49_TETNG
MESACSGEATEEEVKTQEVLRQVQAILDKLTPHNFNDLMKQLSALEITTEARLRSIMELIFDKAALAQNDCASYARMCYHLTTLSVASDHVNFHKLLLRRCQSEFANNQNKEPSQNARRPSLGNLKLISELCSLQVLEEAMMHDCVVSLLKAQDEESLECLCKLLPRFGKDLDAEEAKPQMDQYFDNITHIVQERKTSPRTCLILKDLLDLRKNNWVPPQHPITLSQIHEEEDLKGNNRTGVAEERGKMMMYGEPNWSRHPQETMETSGFKEVPMETVAVTQVTLKTDTSCSLSIIDEGLTR